MFFLPVSKCQSSKKGVSQELKLHHEVAMLNQDCKSSKKGVTQKFKLHHEFTMLNQDGSFLLVDKTVFTQMAETLF